MDVDGFVSELAAGCRATDGVTTLAVFGSATSGSAARRDEWSDVDFAVFCEPAAVSRISDSWSFLPRRDQIVLTAREYDSGGVVLYADGSLLEFGAGLPWPVADPSCEVIIGGADLTRVPAPATPDPANAVRLFLVKLLVGVGRLRRGEVLSGMTQIGTWALTELCRALCGRIPSDHPTEVNPFDPLRRFEAARPALGSRLTDALSVPGEPAARALFDLARALLEPDWPEFPSTAADVVARRLGWDS
ncbi:MAG: hypothetical protein QM804_03715 [Propionicimonas sp.]